MIRKKDHDEIIIDLTGPQGNAFALLGFAQNFCRQLGYTKEETTEVLDRMKSGDYENLVEVFDNEFGHFVVLER